MNDQMDLYQPIMTIARQDMVTLKEGFTVQQALDHIRSHGLGERIVYFYVVDESGQLKGVIPTRRLLTMPLEKPISDLMINRLIMIPQSATILEAYDMLARHKLLALPIVNQQQHIVGVVDIGMFTDEDFQIAECERIEEVFEIIGFRISEIRDASPLRIFSLRVRWLIATIGSGTICALLAGVYEVTLAKSLVLAFFLTLVLGLGESVSMQSMTVTINALRVTRPTLRWYAKEFWKEARIAMLLGAACGLLVGFIVWLSHGAGWVAVAIGSSILLSISAACLFGLSIPTLLHAMRLDPKIAAGPLTLAIADICTVLLYFSVAAVLL